MALRFPRYTSLIEVGATATQVLLAIPVWRGEKIRRFVGDLQCVVGEGTDPILPVDLNIYGLFIDWPILASYGRDTGFAEQSFWPGTRQELNSRIDDLLLDTQGLGSSQYYGGPDTISEGVTGSTNDSVTDAQTAGELDFSPSSTGSVDDGPDEGQEVFLGPKGIVRWFSWEGIVGVGGAEADDEVRRLKTFRLQTAGFGDGLLVVVAKRYEWSDDAAFNWQPGPGSNVAAASMRMVNSILMGADIKRMNHIVREVTTEAGDYARGLLFGADGVSFDDSLSLELEDAVVACSAKATCVVETPYDPTYQ